MDPKIRIAVVAVLASLAATAPAQARASGRLVAFNNCPAMVDYAKAHAVPYVGAYGFGTPVAVGKGTVTGGIATPSAATAAASDSTPQQGVDYSGTNVQETGVDEPDMVKTNGNTLFSIEGGQLESVDVTGHTPRLLDTLPLTNGWGDELLLSGTHLLVVSRGGNWAEPLSGMVAQMYAPISAQTVLTEIDISNPSSLQVVNTLTLDGSYVDARMIGSVVRVVTSSSLPVELPVVTPSGTVTSAAATTANKAALEHSRATAWLPTYRLGKRQPHALVQCRDVRRPPNFSGLGMLTVTTIDLSQGLAPTDSTAVMTDGRIVYASPTTLYVTTEQWAGRPEPLTPTQAPQGATTQIAAFDISDPTKATYLGSGTVPGYLLSQWSLSEFQGVLRVVSTDEPEWWNGTSGSSQTYLTTLRISGGALTQVGQLGGLGQGERVYAVRFIGNDAYVVTFKQVDPLHAIDVSDPANPKLVGELTLAGYSSYLHPISNNLLLGIGQDVGANNEPTGTQVSLFDISDLANPKLVAHASLGQGWSAAESDYHAFLYWPATNLVVVPFGQQAVGLHVAQSGIDELGRIVQTDARSSELPTIDRAIVVRDTLLTVSSAGVESSSLSTFADLGWAAFPQAAVSPGPIIANGGSAASSGPATK